MLVTEFLFIVTTLLGMLLNVKAICVQPIPESCTNFPEGWKDVYGRNCDWYCMIDNSPPRCEIHGDKYENMGFNANEACCVCGGGLFSTLSPSSSLSFAQNSNSPEVSGIFSTSLPSSLPFAHNITSPEVWISTFPSHYPQVVMTNLHSSSEDRSIDEDEAHSNDSVSNQIIDSDGVNTSKAFDRGFASSYLLMPSFVIFGIAYFC